MTVELPTFRYHPDPLSTGSVEQSSTRCLSCGMQRGYIYVGPVFGLREIDDELCPWCIADGSAAARFDTSFTDDVAPPDVPADVVEQVTRRTPGFSGWQQERWLYHCRDGAEFLGPAGWAELEPLPDAQADIRVEMGQFGWTSPDLDDYLRSLDRDASPTAYLFRCRHCGRHLAYTDFI